jgi:hypothetical protein
MFRDADQEIARRTLATLRAVRHKDRETVLRRIGPLRDETANDEIDPTERFSAWIAICGLYDTLLWVPKNEGLGAKWRQAIDKTAAWLKAIE